MQHNTMQCNTMKSNATQPNRTQCNTRQGNATQDGVVMQLQAHYPHITTKTHMRWLVSTKRNWYQLLLVNMAWVSITGMGHCWSIGTDPSIVELGGYNCPWFSRKVPKLVARPWCPLSLVCIENQKFRQVVRWSVQIQVSGRQATKLRVTVCNRVCY